MELITKEFKRKDKAAVEKAIDDELGLDYEITEDENAFNVTIFDIETRKEINIVASIEERFNAVDYFDTI
ncbi:MAG: hypothetical protein EOM59_15530 [Clostridia bacterium]|nr:hypothetical protein [Clostridia bacterium]